MEQNAVNRHYNPNSLHNKKRYNIHSVVRDIRTISRTLRSIIVFLLVHYLLSLELDLLTRFAIPTYFITKSVDFPINSYNSTLYTLSVLKNMKNNV